MNRTIKGRQGLVKTIQAFHNQTHEFTEGYKGVGIPNPKYISSPGYMTLTCEKNECELIHSISHNHLYLKKAEFQEKACGYTVKSIQILDGD